MRKALIYPSVTGAYFRALVGASTNTYVIRYHDSATLVTIAHLSLVNCVKNAGHTPSTSTYFALLTIFKYKRMYDDPKNKHSFILDICMLGVAVYFLPGTKSVFLYVSYEIDSYYRIFNTGEGYIKDLCISYSNDSV